MRHVIVIGGGISGLSAAYYLQKRSAQAGTPLQVTLLESESRWGGKILTERLEYGGVPDPPLRFVVEGGPDTFLRTKPWAMALCRELGLEERLHGTNPARASLVGAGLRPALPTYVLHHGRLHPLPDGLSMMIPTRIAPMVRTSLLSWPAKARMALDYFLPPYSQDGDESLGDFVTRRLGRAAYERLIEPLMSGIYAGDGDQLSLQATFPYLRELELNHGGLIKGALAMRRMSRGALVQESTGASGKFSPAPRHLGTPSLFVTPTTGLAEIVETLVDRLEAGGVDLRLGAKARRITALGGGEARYSVELEYGRVSVPPLQADALILATPAFVSGEMLITLDAQLSTELQSIPYVSTATISLAYRESDLRRPLDGYGYVIPRREGRKVLACTWTSTKFPHRAPEGYALLRVFIGRAGQEDQIPWDRDGLLQVAREELRLTLGITAEPLFARVFIWERAMPQYNLGHPARLGRIQARLSRWPGLALAGNGYHGIGIPDCIHSGEMAAEMVL